MKSSYFSILIFAIFASCALPRYKKQPDGVRMVHYHTGVEYRGVNLFEWFFKFKNPRYGEGYGELVKDPNALYGKSKSRYTTRVKDRRTYVKPPTEEQWVKMLAPDSVKNEIVDSTTVSKSSSTKSKKKIKSKITVDTESSGAE
ncbi:MAG: hypothetical protein ACKVOU_12995 [Cytophagales bacterium]